MPTKPGKKASEKHSALPKLTKHVVAARKVIVNPPPPPKPKKK